MLKSVKIHIIKLFFIIFFWYIRLIFYALYFFRKKLRTLLLWSNNVARIFCQSFSEIVLSLRIEMKLIDQQYIISFPFDETGNKNNRYLLMRWTFFYQVFIAFCYLLYEGYIYTREREESSVLMRVQGRRGSFSAGRPYEFYKVDCGRCFFAITHACRIIRNRDLSVNSKLCHWLIYICKVKAISK